MAHQQIADMVARDIAARVKAGAEVSRWNGRLSMFLPEDGAGLTTFIDEVAARSPRSFCELPIPDSAPGAIGRHDGVIVRVMKDYDFHADKAATRIDVAFS